MKYKKIYLIILIISTFFLFSCINLQITTSNIPKDEDAQDLTNQEKSNWRSDFMVTGAIDVSGFLTPITLENLIRLRVNLGDDSINLLNSNVFLFEDGYKKGFAIDKLTTLRTKTDIVILIDTTGSMGSAINGVKNSIIAFANVLQSSGIDVKLSIIPYDDFAPARDITIDGERHRWLNLSPPSEASDFAEKLYAAGGGGIPENPYEGFIFAWENVSWRARSERIFINITDAPAHYTGDGIPDSGRQDDEWPNKVDVLNRIRGRGTIHSVLTPAGWNWWYNESDPISDFYRPQDVRSLSIDTGGFILYSDNTGNVDLATIGIVESITNSYIITFKSTSNLDNHRIEIYIRQGSKESKMILENVKY